MYSFYHVIEVILLVLGFAGCFIPILPGPPLSFAAILLFHFTTHAIDPLVLIPLGIITAIVTILDLFLPGITSKKFGGSKHGFWGALLGLFAGLILPIPGGLIIGTFLGAYWGEIISGKNSSNALKPAYGSVIGLLLGTIGKALTSITIAIIYVYYIIKIFSA